MVAEATQPTRTEPEATQGAASNGAEEQITAEEKELLTQLEPPATQAEPATEAKKQGTEGKEPPEPDAIEVELRQAKEAAAKVAREEARREVRAETESREVELAEQAYVQGLRQQYDRWAPWLRQQLTDRGLEQTDVDWALQAFTSYNGVIAPAVAMREQGFFWQEAAQALPEEERDKYLALAQQKGMTWPRAIKEWKARVEKAVRQGYQTEAQTEAKLSEARLALIRKFQTDEKFRESVLSRVKVPADRQGGGGTGKAPTLAEIDAMPTDEWLSKPKEERDRLLTAARQNLRS